MLRMELEDAVEFKKLLKKLTENEPIGVKKEYANEACTFLIEHVRPLLTNYSKEKPKLNQLVNRIQELPYYRKKRSLTLHYWMVIYRVISLIDIPDDLDLDPIDNDWEGWW